MDNCAAGGAYNMEDENKDGGDDDDAHDGDQLMVMVAMICCFLRTALRFPLDLRTGSPCWEGPLWSPRVGGEFLVKKSRSWCRGGHHGLSFYSVAWGKGFDPWDASCVRCINPARSMRPSKA